MKKLLMLMILSCPFILFGDATDDLDSKVEAGSQDTVFEYELMYNNASSDGKKWAEVFAEYSIVAEEGSASAQYRLALMYYLGKVEGGRDYVMALNWYYKASQQMHVGALFKMGKMYYFGNGTKQSFPNAIQCYRIAANLGNAEAQFQISSMSGNGLGVERDYVESYAWACLAAEQGFEKAVTQRDEILPNFLGLEDIELGKKRAEELKEIIKKEMAVEKNKKTKVQ